MTNAEIARAQVEAAFAADWQRLRELYAHDVHYVDPDGEFIGAEAAIEHLQQQLGPLPDMRVTSTRVYEGAGFAVCEWTASGTNSGPLTMPDGQVLPPTGREIHLSVLTLYDIDDGKITSERNYYDNMALFEQFGLMDG
jgi:steroid delta-isomerase-like uncharacterized protein